MKRFYLRNAAGFPVCCVATLIQAQWPNELEPKLGQHLVIRYARSVYNLKDAKPRLVTKRGIMEAIPALPYDKVKAVRSAEGRLKSEKSSKIIELDSGPSMGKFGVKAVIVRDIANNDSSQYARDAALLWLRKAEALIARPGIDYGIPIGRPLETISLDKVKAGTFVTSALESEFTTVAEREAEVNSIPAEKTSDSEKLDRIFSSEGHDHYPNEPEYGGDF